MAERLIEASVCVPVANQNNLQVSYKATSVECHFLNLEETCSICLAANSLFALQCSLVSSPRTPKLGLDLSFVFSMNKSHNMGLAGCSLEMVEYVGIEPPDAIRKIAAGHAAAEIHADGDSADSALAVSCHFREFIHNVPLLLL